jgi:CDP-diacylglycerol--glycerol-3-phosphate 3-phosphatidyltransferase
MKNQWLTIPNILSMLRLLSAPVLIYLAWTGEEKWFFILWLISISTDALDGFIARTFHMQTKLGAVLDSLADTFMYVVTVLGVYWLKWDAFGPYQWQAALIPVFLLLPDLVALLKFGKIASLHLYSAKLNGILMTAFVIWLFWKGFHPLFFQVIFWWALWTSIENLVILIPAKTYPSEMKGLWWVYGPGRKERIP